MKFKEKVLRRICLVEGARAEFGLEVKMSPLSAEEVGFETCKSLKE